MLGFILLGIVFTLLIVAGAVFFWSRTAPTVDSENATRRTRSEARQVQSHFEADDDFTRNFQHPTQNEVLETLQMLDHLAPHWDQGDAALVDRRLKNELAESFPSLCKAGCAYPQLIEEDLATVTGGAKLSAQVLDLRLQHRGAETARARENFRSERAQANALHQLTSVAEVEPVALPPGSLPFRVSEEARSRQTTWWVKSLVATATLLALAAAAWFLTGEREFWKQPVAHPVPVAVNNATLPTPAPKGGPVVAIANPPVTEASPTPASEASSTDQPTVSPSPTPVLDDSPAPDAMPTVAPVTQPALTMVPAPDPHAAEHAAEAALAAQVAQSQLRAIDKYPDLAVPNSEMNLRFVFRYKALLADKSQRLQDPDWPEKLADECARAAGDAPKGRRR